MNLRRTFIPLFAFSIACQSPVEQVEQDVTSTEATVDMNEVKMERLSDKLEAKKAASLERWSPETRTLHENGVADVERSGITARAVQVGEEAPEFSLQNQSGDTVRLKDLLERGPVVLTWYRGGWCPYCNLTLHALQQALPEIKAQGATLLALTPELPDSSLSTSEKNDLEFQVLSDLHNGVARDYGVVFKLEEKLAEAYQNGFDLHAYNGDESDELPLAATYVIDTDGKVSWAFLDHDYRKRAEPADIIDHLKTR